MKLAPDFWTSKTTWLAVGTSVACAFAVYQKHMDLQAALQTAGAAWAVAFHRDGTVKAIMGTGDGNAPKVGGN